MRSGLLIPLARRPNDVIRQKCNGDGCTPHHRRWVIKFGVHVDSDGL